MRRRLAALALRQGDDRGRARRLVGGHRLARLADRARRRRAGPRAARGRARPARGRGDPLGPLPAHPAEPRLDRPEGDRGDRERAPRPEGEGARGLGRRALRGADAGDDPALLVALRHDARPRVGGDRHAEARLVRRGRGARPRGRRAGLRRLQDEHRRPGRRAARAHARLRARRRHRPQPDARAARRADAPPRGVPGGHGRQGAADRRPQLQPHDGRDRPRRAGARAVRPRLARGRLVRRGRPRARPAPLADPALLGREPLHPPRLQAVPRGGRDGRRLGRRDLERVRAVAEDRGARRDPRGRLRAAQLLQPPRDLHRGAVVRRDPERPAARDRRRRRPVA